MIARILYLHATPASQPSQVITMPVAASLAPLASTQRPHVAVYKGEGAGLRSLRSAVRSLERLLPPPFEVRPINTEELLAGQWQRQCAMLVMPGGADLPYCRHLNGRGNQLIREFVTSGGSYLGLCAGAYYACGRVEFEVGSQLQVVGDRELAFFPGVACGAAYPGFDYQTERGAVAAPTRFRVPGVLSSSLLANGHIPAACSHSAEETSSWSEALDYCNGGPFFVAAHDNSRTMAATSSNCSSSRSESSSSVEALPGVQVLAWYRALQHPTAAASGAQEAVAALRCEVGAGVAVLCGTHPELGPEWLDPCGGSSTPGSSSSGNDTSSCRDNVAAASASEAVAATAGDTSRRRSDIVKQGSTSAQSAAVAMPLQAAPATCQQEHQNPALVQHTAALRAALLKCQPARELFLECLVYEALRRTGLQSSIAAPVTSDMRNAMPA